MRKEAESHAEEDRRRVELITARNEADAIIYEVEKVMKEHEAKLGAGEKEAVLVDAQFTLADAKAVAERVKATGKALTTVYVSHSHPDHYFGFPAIQEAFPEAKLVALPATIAGIEQTWEAKVKQWKPLYKEAITDKPAIPQPLDGNTIELVHGNSLTTRYAHNAENLVEVGDYVRRGQIIARLGGSGRATAPNLHYEVLLQQQAVDPLEYVD